MSALIGHADEQAPVTLSAMEQMTKSEQLEYFRAAVNTLQKPANGKMVIVDCKVAERAVVPQNYGVASPTEGLRWGKVTRRVQYSFKFDGLHGWEKIEVVGRDAQQMISGHNGQRSIAMSKFANQPTLASIRCSNPRMWNDIPGMYAENIRVLFFANTLGDSSTFLSRLIANATNVDTVRTLHERSVVAIDAPGEFGSVDTAYFSLAPNVRPVAVDLGKGGPTFTRYEFRYDNPAEPLKPTGGTRDVLASDESGGYPSVLTHSELEFDTLRFVEPAQKDTYLPKIPKAAEIDSDCEPIASVSQGTLEASGSNRWVWLLIALPLAAALATVYLRSKAKR